MIDIHSHILYGVDDGSKSLDMSLKMAEIYIENGVKEVIATPHYIEHSKMDSKYEKNKMVLNELNEELNKKSLDLKIHLGNEIYLSNNIIDLIKTRKIFSLNGTRYLLIELPMGKLPKYTKNILYELILLGYRPIIAHPERNLEIIENPNILYDFIKYGVLTQLNIGSVEGAYGRKVRKVSKKLLRNNMIHFLGTDAHSHRKRSPNIKKGKVIIKRIVGSEKFREISELNPRKLIRNEEVKISRPKRYEKKFSLRRIFKK